MIKTYLRECLYDTEALDSSFKLKINSPLSHLQNYNILVNFEHS